MSQGGAELENMRLGLELNSVYFFAGSSVKCRVKPTGYVCISVAGLSFTIFFLFFFIYKIAMHDILYEGKF